MNQSDIEKLQKETTEYASSMLPFLDKLGFNTVLELLEHEKIMSKFTALSGLAVMTTGSFFAHHSPEEAAKMAYDSFVEMYAARSSNKGTKH